MWRFVAVVAAAACGRVGFDAITHPGAPADAPLGVPLADGEVRGLDGQVGGANLIAWYPMDDLTGTGVTAADVTGHGHDGDCAPTTVDGKTEYCPTIVAGRIDSAYQFDGAGAAVRIADAPDLELPSAFTIAVWISIDELPDALGTAAIKPFGTMSDASWELSIDSTGGIHFDTTDGSTGYGLTGANVLPVGSWHHVALRWDGATKTELFDGVADGSEAQPTARFDASSLLFGIEAPAEQLSFAGRLDDLRIYDAALSDAEVAALAAM